MKIAMFAIECTHQVKPKCVFYILCWFQSISLIVCTVTDNIFPIDYLGASDLWMIAPNKTSLLLLSIDVVKRKHINVTGLAAQVSPLFFYRYE